MAKAMGFAPKVASKSNSKSKLKRQESAQKFDEMRQQGLPEFNIFVRICDREWLPAGTMAVQRTNQINQAIFQQETQLRKNILRVLPKLHKYQDQLEFGYRLKEFPDEPIVQAVRPALQPNAQISPLSNLWHKFSNLWRKEK